MPLPIWRPREYQKSGLQHVLDNAYCGLLWSPGVGKTGVILKAFDILRREGEIDALYVVAPKTVAILVWDLMYKEFENFKDFKVVFCHGTKKEKIIKEDADIYILTVDAMDFLEDNREHVWEKSMAVFDESTKFKRTNTNRFKSVRNVLDMFQRRVILTGSFTTNGIMDLFGQTYLVDEGASLGKWITHFRNLYFDSDYMGFNYELQDGAEDKILKKIAPIMHRLDKKDVLDLPPVIHKTVRVMMSKKAMSIYCEIQEDFISVLDEGVVIAGGAAVAHNKLLQLANGGLYYSELSDGVDIDGDKFMIRKKAIIHLDKIKACADLVEELSGNPVLIAYHNESDFDMLQKKFGTENKPVPHIGKGVTAKQLKQIEKAWNAGRYKILLVHPQSAAHGLNIQFGGHHLIWFANTFNLELWEQLVGRLDRDGQTEIVYVYRLETIGTLDEVAREVIESKDENQKSIYKKLVKFARRKHEVTRQ